MVSPQPKLTVKVANGIKEAAAAVAALVVGLPPPGLSGAAAPGIALQASLQAPGVLAGKDGMIGVNSPFRLGGGFGGSESSLCPAAFCASREELALVEEACLEMVHDADTGYT